MPKTVHAFRPLLAAILTAAGAFAQSPVQGADVASGTVASTLTVSGMVQNANPDDDTPLPQDLKIVADCHHGDFFAGGGTQGNGHFRFTMAPDPLAIASSSLCAIEAKAFGYESSVARFAVRSSSGVIDIGVLTIQRNASGQAQDKNKPRAGQTVSATSLQAPAEAVKLYDRGSHSLQQGKFASAAKDFEGAVKIYPEYAEAWLNLGRARESLGTLPTAHDAFIRAAELDPQIPGPPAELGLLAARQNDLATAVKYLDESLRLDPSGSYQACYSDAIVNLMLKRYEAAERAARSALRFGDSGLQARVNYVLGMTLLARGNNTEAKQRLTRYLELTPKAPERDQVQRELARLELAETSK